MLSENDIVLNSKTKVNTNLKEVLEKILVQMYNVKLRHDLTVEYKR